jgi:lysophospholipase L1-like esterase
MYFKTCSYPQIGIHRVYADIKPFLTKEKKIITSEGIEPSESDCLVTLPNCGWVEVKQDGQSVMFKIAKVAKNGTITFPVSEWCYYTYRFQGDGESTYYALVEASPGADTVMDIIKRTNMYLGVYIYTDEGANYEKGYYLGGKHIAAIGDSITQGRFDKDGLSGLDSTTSKSFGELVAETAGDDNFGNFGIGGALVSDSVGTYAWKSLQTNCGKVTGYDVVFVCGGTNDYGNNVTGDTFKAAYTEVVETLMANNAEVICCTPIYRHNRQGANTQGLWLVDYADMIKEVAETKGLKVIDLLKLTSNSNMPRYMPDGLHPNDAGQGRIAERLKGFLQSL